VNNSPVVGGKLTPLRDRMTRLATPLPSTPEVHDPLLPATRTPSIQSSRTSCGAGTTVPVKLIATGLRIVGSVLREMPTPLRLPEASMSSGTVILVPEPANVLKSAEGQPVAVIDEAIQTTPV
jgi:hypothetical protein